MCAFHNSTSTMVALVLLVVLVMSGTSLTISTGSVREWLKILNDEALGMEKSVKMLQKTIDISTASGDVGLLVVSKRELQLKKIKQALEVVYVEIMNIETKCAANIGPDCDGVINCDSKCAECSPITGQCSTCFGNWNGSTCSECKNGWGGSNCTVPVCNSKCTTCLTPLNCSDCSVNWNGPTCSECKSGWKGQNCDIPICDSKCSVCSSPNDCVVCHGNWNGPTCSECKSGWKGQNCDVPICDSKCTVCVLPGRCIACSGNWTGPSCSTPPIISSSSTENFISQCKSGWEGSDCNIPICGSNCITCVSPGVCSTCKTGWEGLNCEFLLGDLAKPNLLTSARVRRFLREVMRGITPSMAPRLIYKATKDTFQASAFHTKCDSMGPNIILIKATTGAIFGGYSNTSWDSNGINIVDRVAFLYSLVSSNMEERFTKLTQQYANVPSYFGRPRSKTGNVNNGPVFGTDIVISHNSDANTDSSSSLCYSYCDSTMVYGTSTANTYLAGATNFKVEDYEVFTFY